MWACHLIFEMNFCQPVIYVTGIFMPKFVSLAFQITKVWLGRGYLYNLYQICHAFFGLLPTPTHNISFLHHFQCSKSSKISYDTRRFHIQNKIQGDVCWQLSKIDREVQLVSWSKTEVNGNKFICSPNK